MRSRRSYSTASDMRPAIIRRQYMNPQRASTTPRITSESTSSVWRSCARAAAAVEPWACAAPFLIASTACALSSGSATVITIARLASVHEMPRPRLYGLQESQ